MSTAVSIASVHCEGISQIVQSNQSADISIANSYFAVSDTFSLVNVWVPHWEEILQNGVSVISNSFRLRDSTVTVPDNLFLNCGSVACDSCCFPLGLFTGNVAFYGHGDTLTFQKLPTRLGTKDLEVDHDTGSVSARGPVYAKAGDILAGGFRLGDDGSIATTGQDRLRIANPNGYLDFQEGSFVFVNGSTEAGFTERMRMAANGVLTIPGGMAATEKLQVTGSIKATGSVQVGNVNVDRPGAIRYRKSGNNTFFEVCMQNSDSTYVWYTIKDYSW